MLNIGDGVGKELLGFSLIGDIVVKYFFSGSVGIIEFS